MDITPRWAGVLSILLDNYSNSNTRQDAINELKRMADLADQYVDAIESITINAVDDQAT
jgi:hypothetical protein